MTDSEAQVAAQRERLAGYTRAQLLHEQQRWKAFSPAAIAATQLLAELDTAEENQRHQEALAESRRANLIGYRALRRADWSLLLALAAIAIAILAWEFPRAPRDTDHTMSDHSPTAPPATKP